MKETRWVIQKNLNSSNDFEEFVYICQELNVECVGVNVIPFSDKLPDFPLDQKINLYYGSTTFMKNVYLFLNKPIGLFFNEETFSMEKYNSFWGKYMLNSEGKITTFKNFLKETHQENKEFFIRPDADDKSFAGMVKNFKEIKNFIENSTKFDNVILDENTKILVSEPYNISKEWRNFIVDGKVVSSSLYRKNFKLTKSNTDIPEDMIKFVEERCKEYQPHKIFVMDIALTGNEYYIIECNCLNSSGFYAADKFEIFKSINNYLV